MSARPAQSGWPCAASPAPMRLAREPNRAGASVISRRCGGRWRLRTGRISRRKHVDPFGDASGDDHRLGAEQRDRAGDRRAKRRARLAQRLEAHPVARARRCDQRSPVRPAGARCDGVERGPRGVAFEPAEATRRPGPTGRRRPSRRKPRRRLAHARSAHPQERPNRCRCRSQEG